MPALQHRNMKLLALTGALAAIVLIAAACGSAEGTESPTQSTDAAQGLGRHPDLTLPPPHELATTDAFLEAAGLELRNCLATSYSRSEIRSNLQLFLRSPFEGDIFAACAGYGVDIITASGASTAAGMPEADAPFGLGGVSFPGTPEQVRALFERIETDDEGTIGGDSSLVGIQFDGFEADAVDISSQNLSLPAGTSPQSVIGSVLVLSPPDPPVRKGGRDGGITWLQVAPPDQRHRTSVLWARDDGRFVYTATADTVQQLETLVRALVEAAEPGS